MGGVIALGGGKRCRQTSHFGRSIQLAAMPVLGETIPTLKIPFGFVESTEE